MIDFQDDAYEVDEQMEAQADAQMDRIAENAPEEGRLAREDMAAQVILDSDNEAIREVLAAWRRMFGPTVMIPADCLPFGLLCYRAGRLRERRGGE